MKKVIQIQLKPTPEQTAALEKTMRRFNEACTWLAVRAFERKLANRFGLHKLYYYELREALACRLMACWYRPMYRPPTRHRQASVLSSLGVDAL